MVWALTALVVILLGALAWYAHASRRRIERLEARSREEMQDLRGEHDKRVNRIRRKLSGELERGHLGFVEDLLPVLDALEQALDQCHHTDDVRAVQEGLEMVARQVEAALGSHDVERKAPAAGEPFDPTIHEAVALVEEADVDNGCVVECFRAGYVHRERLLRPASVSVMRAASGKEGPETDDTPEEAPTDQDAPDDQDEARAEPVRPAPPADSEEADDGSPDTVSSSRL